MPAPVPGFVGKAAIGVQWEIFGIHEADMAVTERGIGALGGGVMIDQALVVVIQCVGGVVSKDPFVAGPAAFGTLLDQQKNTGGFLHITKPEGDVLSLVN